MSASASGVAPAYRDSSRVITTDVSANGEWHTYLFNRASWGAIVAGVVAALVVQLLLNLLGLGVGAASFSVAATSDNPDASSFSMAAGIWWTLSGIIGSFCGGVAAGRLCGASKPNTARWHGFVAWCVTTLVVFYLLTSTLGTLVGGTFNALGSTISTAGKAVSSAVPGVQSAAGGGGGLEGQVRSLMNPNDTQNVQNDVLSYLKASVTGDQQGADAGRDRAVNGLARVANVNPDEARNRLNQVEQQARQTADRAKEQARQTAEAARAGAAKAGILGFVALVIGGIAAWFGGGIGTPRREPTVETSVSHAA